jgi:threonine dehydrogenase-like Zn-dependent dehydrogenase
MVAAGRLDLSPIITSRYGLEEAVTAIAQSTTRQDGKIMVLPNQ